jgi:NAD(P)-dependent dehydrogenase (short-subunit alcohol dehydrogenase family)
MTTVLITGANRGIGLEFVKQYQAAGFEVIATCRDPQLAQELKTVAEKGRVQIVELDVTNEQHLRAVQASLNNVPIDLLINNAGILGDREETFGAVRAENMMMVFRTNSIAPLQVSEVFLPNVLQSDLKTIVAVSSTMGSIASNDSGGYYPYRASKAALNSVMQSMAIDLAPQGVRVLVLHPGWVKTDMGGAGALITTEESVQGMRNVIADQVRLPAPGFYRYDGQMIPF